MFEGGPTSRADAPLLTRPLRLCALLIGVLTVLRLAALALSPWELSQDETQYWFWAQTPAFGYFSKPPLIAWIIAATTSVFGDTEFGVRAAAPLFHGATALMLAAFANRLFGAKAAVTAALLWAFAPAVSISSHLMSTDVPLLFFWSSALYTAYVLISAERANWALGGTLGVLFGAGFLAKYAMIYFPLGLAAAMAISPRLRRPGSIALIAALPPAALLITPNILWNQENAFSTVSHTAANAAWDGNMLNPDRLLAFWGTQFAVIGPIALLALLWAGATLRSRLAETPDADKRAAMLYLVATAAPPLLLVSIQAFLSRAHANWAASAYPAAAVLLAAMLATRPKFAAATISANAVIFAGLAFAALSPQRIEATTGLSLFAEVRGWREQAAAIASYAEGYDVVLADDRAVMGALLFYERDLPKPVKAWSPNRAANHHYEAFEAYRPMRNDQALYASRHFPATPPVRRAFNMIAPIGTVAAPAGAQNRELYLFRLSDVRDDAFNIAEAPQN
ncbi:MAG: glycosyltransferase family 39 protein [Pseudomonadota bacterium]